MPIHQIEPIEVKKLQESGEAEIVDVRGADQHQKEHITGAINMPSAEIDAHRLPGAAGKKLIVHCNRGGGATRLCNALVGQDDSIEIYHLTGGIEAWKAAGLAVE